MTMTPKGQIKPPFVLTIAGLLIIIGAFIYVGWQDKTLVFEPVGQPPEATTTPETGAGARAAQEPTVPSKSTAPSSSQPGTGALAPIPPSAPTTPTPTVPSTPASGELPPVPPAPTHASPWDPGFKAESRVAPYIPSENERATLPSCEGKFFTLDPVDLSSVASISPTGAFGTSSVRSFALFTFKSKGSEYDLYDLYAPGDVYITNIVQEFNITADAEDTTIYFALCKDIFGYVTNVKALPNPIYKMITDSYCLGKPQTGPNACTIEVMNFIGRGSSLGKVGRIAGSFGFGVIDVRYERHLANPASHSIAENFAVCPFAYFSNPAVFFARLTNPNELCAAP